MRLSLVPVVYWKRNPLIHPCMFLQACVRASWVPMVARVLLALVFVVGGFGMLMNFDGTVGFIGSMTNESLATILTILAIVFKLGGGVMLLVNWRTALAVEMLIVFTILATILGHTDFSGDAMQDQMQTTQILKNLAIIGGLLLMGRLAVNEEERPMGA